MTIVPHPFAFHRQVLAFTTLFAILPSPTQALTLPVINDASVSSAKPSTASGNTPKLLVDAKHSALLSFSDASLPTGITSAKVAKATLRLWVNLKKGPDAEVIELHTVPSDWNERQVTYTKAPSATGTPIATRQLSAITPGNWLEIDITESVKSHLDSPSTPAAFRIQPALAVSKASVSFDSKENTGTGHAAWIDLELTAIGTPGTKGDTGATGPAGVPGNNGVDGAQGPIGPAGPQGPQGVPGAQGAAGGPGPKGDTGATGAAGAGAPVHIIGESYQGGIVFYVDADGQHGLIAARADQSAGIRWFNGVTRRTGATGDGIGAGAMNTAIIVATQMGDDQLGNFAAKVAADYSVQGDGITACTALSETCYGDWYLPSEYELNQMYINIGQGAARTLANVGGFARDPYWSSTEYDAANALIQIFDLIQSQSHSYKDLSSGLRVRVVRAF